jgi:hypothetical protein
MPIFAAHALLAFTTLSAAPPPVTAEPPTVRICSPAAMASCDTLAAAAIDPTAGSHGLLAFVDPQTGTLAPPTRDQLAELGLRLDEEVKATHEPTVETLIDGTLRLDTTGIVFTLSAARVEAPAKGNE